MGAQLFYVDGRIDRKTDRQTDRHDQGNGRFSQLDVWQDSVGEALVHPHIEDGINTLIH
jgi:hypothetical protein